ncbi:MAG TPA: bifunctional serine/threonine-protein kinase/formylglycine-generating enzyme family protein [Planctomycetota bacterium]|nr:bifunctional serine/threonine-protein kinase/formylglycine-generating enzyme family protein [Planctomycetota bacterium]
MADRPPDELLAQHLRKAGIVTDAELRTAMQAQAESAALGRILPLGEILVQQGVLTPVQREKIERQLGEQRDEAKRLGPYRILKKLGEGGMGAVYLAEDPSGQKVALKVLPKVAAQREDLVRRFLREVDAARKLEHPNIVRAGEAGQDKGFHYYVMEYVEGETLGSRLKRTEFVPPDEATRLVLQIAHGLKYAHGRGFIHRDIKPDNIIVTKEGVAKILDMGLSKNIEEAQTFRTVTGVLLGTPHYIAPEQAQGDKGIDGRADIYSLGATYYHLVTGETPFHGTTAIEIIGHHLHKQIPDPRDIRDGIPEGVVHIIRNMMAKKPEDRYRDCAELIADLERVLEGRNPGSRALEAERSAVALPMAREARERFRAQRRGQRPGTYRATTKSKRHATPWVAGGLGAAVVLVIVLAVAAGGTRSKLPEPARTAANEPRAEVPRPREPEPLPRTRTPQERREEEAERKYAEIEAAQGRFAEDEIRRRFQEFAREYGDTARGGTVARRLKETEPARSKPAEPAVAEAPKPEVPKPPEPAPPPPVAKPPEPASVPPILKPPPTPPSAPAGIAASEGKPRRPAVPDPARQREADAKARETFALDKAKTAKEKAEVARTLLATASTSGAKEAELYVLLRLARALAASGLDVRTALEAIDALAAAFDVDATVEKIDLFTKATPKGAEAAEWAEAALDEAEKALEADNYEAAVKLAARAEALARASTDKELQEVAKERARELANLKRLADGLKSHVQTLETKPDDAVANAAVGKFVCLVKGEWARGLPMMAKGSDAALKALAERELANPADAEEQAALGRAWKTQAEKETPTYKAAARERAREWLERAIPGLTGLKKVAAQRDLDSLGASAAPKSRQYLDLGGGVRMELVYLRPGTFTMGGTLAPGHDWQADERPEHKVTITRAYHLGKYEVTRGQFAAFVKATGYKTDAEKEGKAWGRTAEAHWQEIAGNNWRTPATFTQTDDHPVVCVSWNDARAFCDWATKRTGRTVRLPTEAEWEYACRAGTRTTWSFGDDGSAMGDYGWYDNNSGMQTHPVGRKKPNAWGLYDMHGNVWEWCQDWAEPYAASEAVDPLGSTSGDRRVLRGGAWDIPPACARSAFRHHDLPGSSSTGVGFRVAVE